MNMRYIPQCPDIFSFEKEYPCVDTQPIYDEIFKSIARKHEELLNSVLRQLLGRDPGAEDYKLCCRVRRPNDELNDYLLTYNDIPLGKVSFIFYGPKTTITFTPYAGII